MVKQRQISISRMVYSVAGIILLLSCLVSILGGYALASGGEGFSLSPLSFEAVLEPEEEQTVRMTVRNVGASSLHFRIYACDVVTQKKAGGAVVYVETDDSRSESGRWFSMVPAELSLNAGEEQVVDVILRIPRDAAAGSYPGVVFAETIPDPRGAAQVGNRIGMLTYVTVGQHDLAPVTIESIRIRNWWRTQPYLEMTIRNPASMHQRVSGQIHIEGNQAAGSELEISRIILLPEEVRKVTVPWSHPPRWGRFRAEVQLKRDTEMISRADAAFILFPAASAVGVILLGLSLWLIRGKPEDPLARIKRPGL